MAHPLWPLFDLRITTPRLELRLPTDDDLVALMNVVEAGIHPPDWLPFHTDWVGRPSPERERGYIQHHWLQRAQWVPEKWNLPLAVFERSGAAIGSQGIGAERFAQRGVVSTGSWLGQAYQGRGYGIEMRAAVLELAFAHLGATEALSGARIDNGPSLGVSARLGYEPNGATREMMGHQLTTEQHLRLTRSRWAGHRPPLTIEVTGLERCLDLFGCPRG